MGFVPAPRKMLSTNHPHLETCRLARSEWSLPEYVWVAWFISILCACVCICLCVYAMCVQVPQKCHKRTSVAVTGTWCRCRELHLAPLGEQLMFSSFEPSFHPLLAFLNNILKTALTLLEVILRYHQRKPRSMQELFLCCIVAVIFRSLKLRTPLPSLPKPGPGHTFWKRTSKVTSFKLGFHA